MSPLLKGDPTKEQFQHESRIPRGSLPDTLASNQGQGQGQGCGQGCGAKLPEAVAASAEGMAQEDQRE